MSVEVKEKVHDLKQGLKDIEVNGLYGNLAVGWWVHPMKFFGDPVLGAAEAVVPKVTSIIPFSDLPVGFGLDVTAQAGKALYGLGSATRVLKKTPPKSDQEFKEEMQESVFEETKDFFFGALSLANTGVAFGLSLAVDVVAAILNPFKLKRWVEAVAGIFRFFIVTGIGEDFLRNAPDLLTNLIIMGKTQDVYRDDLVKEHAERLSPTMDELDEGFRFMKCSTAAYGGKTITAANQQQIAADEETIKIILGGDTGRELASRINIEIPHEYKINQAVEVLNRKKISQHIGIPQTDIIMFVNPGGSTKYVRHFIAVDEDNKEVILAIRGTYSFSELLVDASGETIDFCGGKAHSGIAHVTNNLWELCGDVVNAVLDLYPGYKLIICGHSLGGGTACLLTIKCYAERLVGDVDVRCMSYASPSVFTPLIAAETAVSKTINFIHDNDCVSFLSAANARELLKTVEIVDKKKGNIFQQMQVILGAEPSTELVEAVKYAGMQKEKDVEGAVRSFVPAKTIVWMRKNKTDDDYTAYNYIPEKLLEIYVNEDMILDHFPPFYEEALNKLTNRE